MTRVPWRYRQIHWFYFASAKPWWVKYIHHLPLSTKSQAVGMLTGRSITASGTHRLLITNHPTSIRRKALASVCKHMARPWLLIWLLPLWNADVGKVLATVSDNLTRSFDWISARKVWAMRRWLQVFKSLVPSASDNRWAAINDNGLMLEREPSGWRGL